MAGNYNAQNSITIRRLRSSDSLMLSLGSNGKPLFQAVDKDSGAVNPNWEVANNQPIVIPIATSSRGNIVTHIWHKWKYNGVEIIFDEGESPVGGWSTDESGRFQTNESGHLKIIKNLASQINLADDTLTYETQVSVGGVEYELTATKTIVIHQMGSSSYYAVILSDTDTLTSSVPSTTVTVKLYQGTNEITSFYPKWSKDFDLWTSKNGQKTITVTRDDVGGSQLFLADIFKSESDTASIAKAGVKIRDLADEHRIVIDITSANKMVWKDVDGTNHNVTCKAKVVNVTKNAVITPTNPTWRMDVMDTENWVSLKTSNTDTITVTPAETDIGDDFYDRDVIAEVWFD